MPWNDAYFPASMRHLGAAARAKAIRIAIAKAKDRAQDHGLPVRDDDRNF